MNLSIQTILGQAMAKRNENTPEKKKRQSARVPKLETLGKYKIEKEIGAGGMGAVFLARDTRLNRLAALKILPRDKAENPVLVKRFKAEGQAAAHLRHENIVSVYDAGEEDGYLYIALEYVEGTDLHNLINKRNRIPVRRSLEIITQVTEALAHAYQQGIVHRDIKPANILIRLDGVVKLTDLGLARSIDDNTETSITRAGTTVGTVDYMAPEQARDSKAADIRSDIYSLGCTWYHMLTGRAPFSEGSLTNKLAAHATSPPPDPRELNDRVPEGIVAIIHRMMAKPQADRYQTPSELLEDLKNSNLKRSNVGNDVLEALANDESDGEQPAFESDQLPAADSSDFLINQFMPDYSNPADDHEDEDSETQNRLSTSFDLQQLAGEVDFESDVTVPGLKQPAKPAKGKKKGERRRSSAKRQEPQDEGEGSVISDSAMKTRQAARSPKQDSSSTSTPGKGTRPVAREKQTPEKPGSRKGQGNSARPPKKSLKTTNVPALDEPAAGDQIAVDYKQIAMLAGAVLLLILLIWWGINALGISGDGPQQGPASNPFATAEQNQQGNSQNAEDQPESAATGEQPVEDSSQSEVAVTDVKSEVEKSKQKREISESWKNMSVRGQEKKHLPDWGAAFSALSGPNAVKLDPRLPVLKVAEGKNEPGVWDSLNKALDEVTSRGAVIRLYGTGPFLLKPHRLKDISQLIIMADADQRPTILMQPNKEKEKQSEVNLFSFSSGLLRFQGVDLLCDASTLSGSGVCNILELNQSDLTFQDSSFTLTGTTDRALRLVHSTGGPRTTTTRPEGESRIFLENSVIMGQKLEAVRVDQIYADVLISNCFLSSIGAPCLEMDSLDLALTPGLLLQERQVPRTARIFSSTLLSDQTIFALAGPREKKKPVKSDQEALASGQTDIVVINSVLIGSPKNKQAAMLTLDNWPQDKLRSQSASRFDEIQLQLENSLLWGWPAYLRSTEQGNTQNVFQIDSHRTWQQSWGTHVAADMFQSDLPAELDELMTPAFIKPLLEFSKQKNVYAISADGVTAGCDPARLNSLTESQQRRIKAVLGKPDIEREMQGLFAKAKAVTFDMTKGNLSDFLNSPAISGPTRVNLSGQGICYMSPVALENKQIQLVFQHKGAESPQVVELKLLPTTVKTRSKSGIEAFFSLKNSTLDISGGAFRISPERKGVVPKHFVVCQNSRLGLDQCALAALLVNDNRFESAVHIEPGTKGKSNQIQIENSFITVSGTIIQSESSQLDLEVSNSLFLSQQDIFAFPLKPGDSPGIHVALNQSTFAPRGSVFAIKEESGGSSSEQSAIQVIAEESLFLPAPASSASRSDFSKTASLISARQSSSSPEGIEWWGNSNGYMVERFNAIDRATGNSPGAGNDFSAGMKSLFGTDAEQHELSMRGGIILQDQKLPPLVKLQPVHFQLLPTCKAATWSALKQPLGADPAVLQKIIEGKQGQDKSGRLKRAF